MLVFEPANAQRDQAIYPRRLDSAPTAISLLMFEDPLDGFLLGGVSQRIEAQPVINRANRIFDQVNQSRQVEPGRSRQRIVGALLAVGQKFIDGMLGWDFSDWMARQHDGQRDDATPSPTGEPVNAERRPIGQQDHFSGETRSAFPLPLTKQGQPNPGEYPGAWNTTTGQDKLAGPGHWVRLGIDSA